MTAEIHAEYKNNMFGIIRIVYLFTSIPDHDLKEIYYRFAFERQNNGYFSAMNKVHQ